jgi:predicted transcriptional regulator
MYIPKPLPYDITEFLERFGVKTPPNKVDEAKQQLLDASQNIVSAPEEYQTALKNYLTISKGPGAYQQYMKNEYKFKAEKIAEATQNQIENGIQKAKNQLTIFSSLLKNYSNVDTLYVEYNQKNHSLVENIEKTNDTSITNDRKTFYEAQLIQRIKKIHQILFYINVFLLCIFVGYIISQKKYENPRYVITILFFVCFLVFGY